MVVVADYLSVGELEELYEAAEDVTSSRRIRTIYLLANGHSIREVNEITSFGLRWVEQLLERYNAFRPSGLGDRRWSNGSKPSVLKPELLERCKRKLMAASGYAAIA